MTARVFDGAKWLQVVEERSGSDGVKSFFRPKKPIINRGEDVGAGSIFVSIVSYKDGIRCGKTLKALFDNSKDPGKITVGLVEQNDARDAKCLEEFCRLQRSDARKAGSDCPHFDQVRYVAVYDLGAQGPVVERALQRKNLGDEEYCLQIDSHSDFTSNWDQVALQQWASADNEYAVISTVPPDIKEKHLYEAGAERHDQVPRICRPAFNGANLPLFKKEQPFEFAENLRKPLLAHGWNAGFSFAKCHMEEAAPYDYFMSQIFDGEEFPRYARLWTRGYDVYTPTHNIVYHDYGQEPDGHDMKGWPKQEVLRRKAIERIFTVLQMNGGDANEEAQANLGLFGLGKRRSIDQLMDFVGINLRSATVDNVECGKKIWVPYDSETTSAMDNLYDHADDLDPQPEYPIRTKSQQPMAAKRMSFASAPKFKNEVEKSHPAAKGRFRLRAVATTLKSSNTVSRTTLFAFWMLGIIVWYYCFAHESKGAVKGKKGANSKLRRGGARKVKKTSSSSQKNV